MLLTRAIVSLKGIIVFFKSDGALHVLVQDQDQARHLASAQLQVEFIQLALEEGRSRTLLIIQVTSSEEGLRCQAAFLLELLLELEQGRLRVGLTLLGCLSLKPPLLHLEIPRHPAARQVPPEPRLQLDDLLLRVYHGDEVGASSVLLLALSYLVEGVHLLQCEEQCLLHVALASILINAVDPLLRQLEHLLHVLVSQANCRHRLIFRFERPDDGRTQLAQDRPTVTCWL